VNDRLHIALGQLVNAAYALNEGQPFTLPEGMEQSDTIYGKDLDGAEHPFGIVATDTVTKEVYVGIRGTDNWLEWITDGEALLVGSTFAPGARCELGFLSLYLTLRLTNGPISSLPAVSGIAGHSLGGPLATMLATANKARELVCFASPKPGNLAFAQVADESVASITLYANVPDVVPHVPLTLPPWESYTHIAPLTVLDSTGSTHGLRAAHDLNTYLKLLGGTQP